MSDLVGVAEAARMLNRSERAVRRAIAVGRLDAVRIGARSYAISTDAIAAYRAYTSQRAWRTDPASRPGPKPKPRKRRR